MRVTFDRRANAAYIYLIPSEAFKDRIAKQEVIAPPHMRGTVVLDLDKRGRILGIEVLGATSLLPYDLLDKAERI